jgi:hypothetical protein
MAGFGQHQRVLGHGAGALETGEVGVAAGKDEHLAVGQLTVEVGHEVEAVAPWHADVAEEEVGGKIAGAGEGLLGGVGHAGVEAVAAEDDSEGVGDDAFVVHDKDVVHWSPLEGLTDVADGTAQPDLKSARFKVSQTGINRAKTGIHKAREGFRDGSTTYRITKVTQKLDVRSVEKHEIG